MIAPLDGLLARLRSLWRGLRPGSRVDADMDEEFSAHVALRADDLVMGGMAPDEALRRARLEFGIPDRYKEAGRAARGLWLADVVKVSRLDVVLGLRMLVKYPGITLVGGLAMAFAIWVGAGAFELVTQVLHPTLPLPDGDRIVAVRLRDAERNRLEPRALHDLAAWRERLVTVRDLGAWRPVQRNLVIPGGMAEPVQVAEIDPVAFRLARVPAVVGRPLVAADLAPGAPPVLVLGHEPWRTRFAADPAVVGRTVRLGAVVHTIVGVMPEGFGFPVSQELWVPLRADALDHARREGPAISVFGRLADGATLDEAHAELATLGRRHAAEWRDTHEHLRPEVLPWARSVVDLPTLGRLAVMSINLPLVMLLVLVCGNVALLMFARAASREGEIVVRSALGATRGRIVAQLFAEALVLGGVAAAVGLVAAGAGLRWLMDVVEAEMLGGGSLPFWFRARLSPATVLYAALLTVLGAAIAGVGPALKVTRGLGARLRQASAGGGGLRFGGVWTAVIVAQVAVTLAFPVVAFALRRDQAQIREADVGFPAGEYLATRVEMDREPPPGAPGDTSEAAFRARYEAAYRELARRLLADPAVLGVTFGDRLPRMYHPHRLVEVDSGGAAPLHPAWPAYRVSSATVDRDFVDVVGVPVRAGRGFGAGDLAEGARTVLVNESFVKRVLGGRNPIGRRVRYLLFEEREPRMLEEPTEWYEIVGVVPDMGTAVGADAGQAPADDEDHTRGDPKVSGIYHPGTPADVYPANVAVHVRGEPTAFVARLRAIAGAADPSLRLYEPVRLDAVNEGELRFLDFWYRMLLMTSVVALTLSLAGIYAVMSFTVARRTREIGIRIALGAARWRIVAAVFRRPLLQVTMGVAAGTALVLVLNVAFYGGSLPARAAWATAAYVLVMLGVCLGACVAPVRRALAVEPTEALRAE